MLEDGNLEYICRKDNMCKVRGFRVDLLGVEVVMLSYPGITEACVTYFTDSGGTNILFGYFTKPCGLIWGSTFLIMPFLLD